jgi:hypothetical protein
VLAVFLAVMLTLGTGSVIASAKPAGPLVSKTYWQYNDYDNYFYWLAICTARGREMIRTLPGVVGFKCHLDASPKWSMNVQWK